MLLAVSFLRITRMNFSIAFRDLPFVPVASQVIYIEKEYDRDRDEYIRHHFHRIRASYASCGKEFIYLPLLADDEDIAEKVRYYAPYLEEDVTYPELPKSSLLLDFLADPAERDRIRPSIIWYDGREGDLFVFKGRTTDKADDLLEQPMQSIIAANAEVPSLFSKLRRGISHAVCRSVDEGESCVAEVAKESAICDDDACIEPIAMSEMAMGSAAPSMYNVHEESIEPYIDDIDVEETLRQLELTVKRLQLKGITTAAIHELIDKQERLSRMVITPDYHIFLPDYGNREIKITPLSKAVYFLFLRYPEGLRLKELCDHHTELFNIYRQLKPNFRAERMHVTVTQATNPLGNRIHECLSVIRSAFVSQFDERLARHYFVTGKAGEEYRITLDRELVEWEEP